jgi:hypothetical protein
MAQDEIKHMRAHCKRCDFVFGDPESYRSFSAFTMVVLNHACIPIMGFNPATSMLNDFLRMEYQ